METVSVIVYLAIFFTVLWSEFVMIRSVDHEILKHLGTQTPYRFQYTLDDNRVTFPGCIEQKIWILMRHGTRFPSSSEISGMKNILPQIVDEILENHRIGKGELTEEQLEELKNWSTNLDEDQDKLLTEEGGDEMLLMAERMKKRFPEAIPNEYTNDSFSFRYTATERARESAKYFTIGLFDRKQACEVWYPPAKDTEDVLRFYKHCDKWQKEVKENEATYHERNLYGESEEMKQSLDDMSTRLGLQYRISLENATLIYKVCGFETAWNKFKISPWCNALDLSGAQKFEYYYDLGHYWQDGYPYELTYKQACKAVKDMFDHFTDDSGPVASFLFAHSGTMLKTLAHLGLYKPESHLTADHRQTQRGWRATAIDCFATNLAFVLYKCRGGDYVLPLHQERPVTLAPCSTPLCPLRVLQEHYRDSIHNCNLTEMCTVTRARLT